MDEYRGVVPSTFQVVYTGIYWGLPKPCNGGIISSPKLTVRRKLMVGRRSFPFGIRPAHFQGRTVSFREGTLQRTNISRLKVALKVAGKMIFLFHRWDM